MKIALRFAADRKLNNVGEPGKRVLFLGNGQASPTVRHGECWYIGLGDF